MGIFENIVGILVKNSRIFDPLGRILFFKAGIYWNISPKKADLGNIYPCLAAYFFGIFDLSWEEYCAQGYVSKKSYFSCKTACR